MKLPKSSGIAAPIIVAVWILGCAHVPMRTAEAPNAPEPPKVTATAPTRTPSCNADPDCEAGDLCLNNRCIPM